MYCVGVTCLCALCTSAFAPRRPTSCCGVWRQTVLGEGQLPQLATLKVHNHAFAGHFTSPVWSGQASPDHRRAIISELCWSAVIPPVMVLPGTSMPRMHGMGKQLVCRTPFSSLSSSCSFSYFLTLLQNFSEKEKTVHANFFSEVRSVVWTVYLSPWYHNVSVVVTLHTATNLIWLGQSLLAVWMVQLRALPSNHAWGVSHFAVPKQFSPAWIIKMREWCHPTMLQTSMWIRQKLARCSAKSSPACPSCTSVQCGASQVHDE